MGRPSLLSKLLLLLLFAPTSCTTTTHLLEGSCIDPSKRATSPSTNPVVKIRWDGWQSTQIASTLAAIILQERMGFEVEFVSSDGSNNYVYEKVASGEVDAAFEVWPAGKEKLFDKYASFNTSGDKPVHAFKYPLLFGRSGIFEFCHRKAGKAGKCKSGFPSTPQNVASVLATSSGFDHFNTSASLAVPSNASKVLCATAGQSYGCDADGIYRTAACKATPASCVPLFHATPEMDTGVIEGLAEKLKLAVAITYVGIDRLHDVAWEGFTEGFGGLFYSYEPAAYIHGLPAGGFPRAVMRPDTDIQATSLQRLVRSPSNSISLDLHAFVTKFDLTKEDYAELAAHQDMSQDIHATVCGWLKKHEDRWETWVSFPSRKSIPFTVCTDGFCLIGCWTALFVQIVFAFIAFCVASWVDINETEAKAKFERNRACSTAEAIQQSVFRHQRQECNGSEEPFGCKSAAAAALPPIPDISIEEELEIIDVKQVRPKGTPFGISGHLHLHAPHISSCQSHKERMDFEKSFDRVPNFLSHVRSFRNFTRSNVDANLCRPSNPFSPSRWTGVIDRRSIYRYVMTTDAFIPVFLEALGIGLLSSSLGSFFYLLLNHEVYQDDDAAFRAGQALTSDTSIANMIAMTAVATRDITSSFKFFPTFLLIGYVGYIVTRWQNYQSLGFGVQGRIHDIGVMVGGSLKQPEQPETQQFVFRIYRYLNLVHLLLYKTKNAWFSDLTSEDYVSLGLMTPEEVQILEPMDNKMRDCVVGWLSCEVQSAIEKGICERSMAVSCIDNVGYLRGKCASFHDMFETNHPNTWATLMQAVVDMLICIYVVGTALTAFNYKQGCFQPFCLIFTIFLSLPFLCCSRIFRQLSNPYVGRHDTLSVDALMSSTEQSIFATLRSKFDHSKLASVANDVKVEA